MLGIDQNNSFSACWNENNAQLNPNKSGLRNTIRKVVRLIFCIPNLVVAACINPRRESRFYPSSELSSNDGSFTKEIITPDHVHLSANVHIVKGATVATPTVLLFNPLGANRSIHYGLKKSLLKKGCNVITFDYRGLGTTRRAEDLIVDGDSVYQYVAEELGTRLDKIHFYGFSLGGAFAAQVKALHTESTGKYVGDRVFKSVFRLITENCCIVRLGPLIKKITSFISAILIAYPIYLLGWEWDGCQAWSKIKEGKCLVYHPNDCLVPFMANLASLGSAEKLIQLDPKENGPTTHFSGLDEKNTAEGLKAITLVTDFLKD